MGQSIANLLGRAKEVFGAVSFDPPVEGLLIPEDQASEASDDSFDYRYWRIRIFSSIWIGYAFFYLSRKSFTFAMPGIMQDLGFSKSQLGILSSVLSISYAFSKFTSGIIVDRSSPRIIMGVGLLLTGVVNILFGMSSSLYFFAFLWALNGLFQGLGAPACARYLVGWFSSRERGRWWSLWNTSHNFGGAAIPILAGLCTQYFGWRYAMFVPGVLCILMGLFLLNRLKDDPKDVGLPPIEEDIKEPKNKGQKESVKDLLWNHVLSNKLIVGLSLAYFFVYIIRTGFNDWILLFLTEKKHYSPLIAGATVSWFEVGGLLGSLLAGWSSDLWFNGRRTPSNILFTLGAFACIMALGFLPINNHYVDSFLIFLSGLFIFGPQMLVGLSVAEMAGKKAAGTATGVAGLVAYIGAALAGWPLGVLINQWGWSGFFTVLAICAPIAIILMIPSWSFNRTA